MDESQLLISKLDDLIYSNEYGTYSFLGFLNEREAALACSYLKNRNTSYKIYGGYKNADRVYICIDSDCSESLYPITPLEICSKGKKELSHRDYLGSLMGLGIKRECIGDIILLSKTSSVVFVRNEISTYLLKELTKVGNESVVIREFTGNTEDFSNKTVEDNIIVTSMRIDNILSSVLNCSRSQAFELINDKRVFINYYQVLKPSLIISEDDIISVRGNGKFIIGKQIGKTKRERIVLNIFRYV